MHWRRLKDFFLRQGRLEWVEPQGENLHVEIAVRDGTDNRFIPCLKGSATPIDPSDKVLGTHEHPMLWHPCINHYGRNWTVPGNGRYTLKVHIDPPEFPRHDKINGCRFIEAVQVAFENVEVKTGRKMS